MADQEDGAPVATLQPFHGGRLPRINRSKGDFTESYSSWLGQLNVQISALNIPTARRREVLLCMLESSALGAASALLLGEPEATFEQLSAYLQETFMGEDYRRLLQPRLRQFRYTGGNVQLMVYGPVSGSCTET